MGVFVAAIVLDCQESAESNEEVVTSANKIHTPDPSQVQFDEQRGGLVAAGTLAVVVEVAFPVVVGLNQGSESWSVKRKDAPKNEN